MDKLDTKSKETRLIELTQDELETVVGGNGKSGGNASGHHLPKIPIQARRGEDHQLVLIVAWAQSICFCQCERLLRANRK